MSLKGWFFLALALAFGMMVLSAFSYILAYLLAFGLIGLMMWGLIKLMEKASN